MLLFGTFVLDVTVATPKAHAATMDSSSRISDTLEQVETSLANARGDAARLTQLLRATDATLARANHQLAAARARWTRARQKSLAAAEALGRAQTEVWHMERIRGLQARRTYMTNGHSIHLSALLGAENLRQIERQLVVLDRIASASNEALERLRRARDEAAAAKRRLKASERAARANQKAVAAKVHELEQVRAVRARTKASLDQRISDLVARKADLSHRQSALVHRVAAEEAASDARTARIERQQPHHGGDTSYVPASGTCDLSGVSADARWLIMHESSGRPDAANPNSTAFGLGQLIRGNRIRYLGEDYDTTDCGKQLEAFHAYVEDSYGSASAARAFWEANGWY